MITAELLTSASLEEILYYIRLEMREDFTFDEKEVFYIRVLEELIELKKRPAGTNLSPRQMEAVNTSVHIGGEEPFNI